MNVLKELFHSVYDLGSYPHFMEDRKRKTFLFGLLLMFLYVLVTVVMPVMRYPVTPGRLAALAEEQVPEFSIDNQTVTVGRVVEFKNDRGYISINTESVIGLEQIREILRTYSRVLIMDAEKMVIQSQNDVQMISYSEMDPDLSFSKTELLNLIERYRPVLLMVLVGILLLIFLMQVVWFFMGMLVIALLGMIVASCMQYEMTFGELYKLGIYTRTLPLCIKALLSFLPFGIPFYFLISLGISLAYMAGAIGQMKRQPLLDAPLVFSSNDTGPVEREDDFL